MADFIDAVQTGANLQSMAWQRQERVQALRSQEALRALQERQIAANAQMLMSRAQLYDEQAQQVMLKQRQRQAVLVAGQELYNKAKTDGADDDTAMKSVIAPITMLDPDLGEQMAGAYLKMRKTETEGQPTPHQQALEGIARERVAIDKQAETRLAKEADTRAEREKRLAKRYDLSEGAKAQIGSIYKQVEMLNKARLALDPDEKGNKTKRFRLATEAGALMKQAKGLESSGAGTDGANASTAAPARVRVKSPDGKVGSVPADQLEDALSEGYEEVE